MKKHLLILIALLGLSACGDATKLYPAKFNDLNGWNQDAHADAFSVFVDSCHASMNRGDKAWRSREEGPIGVRENWEKVCADADALGQPTNDQARQFFETHFMPYRVTTESKPQGLMTGYYEPLLRGSRTRHKPYLTPVYGVPKDLYKPYYTREEIVGGALRGKAPVLLYVDDPVMLFFLHIQGSGKVKLDNGQLVGLQYAAQNGHEFVPIGRILKERGEMQAVSMQAIHDWLIDHPSQMNEVMNQNPSYIFFKLSPGNEAAKGALGLPLTKLRSLAIDDDRAAYGVPTYVDTTQSEYPTGSQVKLQRLFISQDTGGALHGPHRGDIFYGRGEREEWQAGHQQAKANVFWLLPQPPAPQLAPPTPAEVAPEVPAAPAAPAATPATPEAVPTSPFQVMQAPAPFAAEVK